MGTNLNGKKPKNNATISRGTEDVAPPSIDTKTGQQSRSFAQPSPAVEHSEIKPKVHASKEEEEEALKRHSTREKKDSDS